MEEVKGGEEPPLAQGYPMEEIYIQKASVTRRF